MCLKIVSEEMRTTLSEENILPILPLTSWFYPDDEAPHFPVVVILAFDCCLFMPVCSVSFKDHRKYLQKN